MAGFAVALDPARATVDPTDDGVGFGAGGGGPS